MAHEPDVGVASEEKARPATAPLPRLLVLTSTYPRWVNDPEPAFVHELARRLVDRFDVLVLCPHSAGAARREQLDGVQVVRYGYAPNHLETLVNHGGILGNLKRSAWKWLLVPGFVVGQWCAVLRVRRTWHPDLVHAHWLLPQGIVAAAVGAAPLVVTSHGADLFALKGRLFRWLRGKVVARAAAVTVVSAAMKIRLQSESPQARVDVMPMGVDLNGRFAPAADVKRSRQKILFVGRLVEKKGLAYLIQAMPGVLARHPETRLDIVGFGPESARLMEMTRQLGLSASVRFVGAVPQSELARHYQEAAVFVAPFVEAEGGDQEGLGLVVAEALGCSCPVIVGDVPAVHDLIGDAKDCVVPQRSSAALTEAIISVLDDPERVAQCTSLLRDRCLGRFSWNEVANRYAALFDTLKTSRRGSDG